MQLTRDGLGVGGCTILKCLALTELCVLIVIRHIIVISVQVAVCVVAVCVVAVCVEIFCNDSFTDRT